MTRVGLHFRKRSRIRAILTAFALPLVAGTSCERAAGDSSPLAPIAESRSEEYGKINHTSTSVHASSSQATTSVSMNYNGDKGEVTAYLEEWKGYTLLKSAVPRRNMEDFAFPKLDEDISQQTSLSSASNCGLTYRGWGEFEASTDAYYGTTGTGFTGVPKSVQLPPCAACGGDEMLISDPGYDPYNPGGDDCGGSTGDGGSGMGSGVYYSPGETTGGQTVFWGTGEGSGNTSVCGSDAVVEYVCLDFYDASGNLDYRDCGYATTCG